MDVIADFGSGNTGLVGTLGYALYGASAALIVARTTAGIAEIGATGAYVANIEKTKTQLYIVWDTGGGSPIYAVEDLTSEENNTFLRNKNVTFQTGTPRQTIYQDDNSTVYMEGDAFQDHAEATPYQGEGIEARHRLT